MRIDMADFQKKHLELYHLPGYFGSSVFWKMEKLCEDAEAFYLPEHDFYYVIRDKHLLMYYSPDGQCHIPVDELNSLNCISMDAGMFDTVKDRLSGFEISYNEKLHYDKNYVPPILSGDKNDVVEFDFSNEEHYARVAHIINGCYDGNGNFSSERVKRIKSEYESFSVFDPSLWFFVRDKEIKKLIGIALSTYQKSIKQTVLDWIFILPEFHGAGAGRFMIQEIIRRSLGRSDSIIVGGLVAFYKKCGFYTYRRDVWAAKPGYSFNGPFA